MSGLSANLADALEALLVREGGYVNDPNDAGGETKYGISKRSYPNEDIKNLTPERAKAIYTRDFYNAPGFHKLPLEYSEPVFDLGVHSGPAQAVRIMQRTVRAKADGALGPATVAAVTSRPAAEFRRRFAVERLLFYLSTILARPTNLKYARNWFGRAMEFI